MFRFHNELKRMADDGAVLRENSLVNTNITFLIQLYEEKKIQ